MTLNARLLPSGQVWCGKARCRGVFGYVIMDAGPSNQFFVLDPGFHRNSEIWEKSRRAQATGKDRRGHVATFGGPRAGHARYSPPERPARLRCPRCGWVSEYNGEGESPEVAKATNIAPADRKEAHAFSISASEWWKAPQEGAKRTLGFLRKTFPPQD